MASTSVLLAGATGLVGGECLKQLAQDEAISRIVVLSRRSFPLPGRPAGLPAIEPRIVDFDHLAEAAEAFRVDAILCALGTTIRQAGSQEAFRLVDYGYPLALARLGIEQGVKHFLLVSALGADPHSRVFYNRVKGEVEQAIAGLSLPSLTIFQPSLLLGQRAQFRLGEELAKRLAFLIPGKYKPIQARDVAAAMVAGLKAPAPGITIIPSARMQPLRRRPLTDDS